VPRLRAEGRLLKSRALAWCVCAGAGAALAALAGLLGRWSANPALGWAVALGAAGLGRAASSAFADAPEDGGQGARAWALAGAVAALAAPALLRVAGLSDPDPALLRVPLQGGAPAALGLTALLAALAACAWSRASRGAGRAGAAAALAGGIFAQAGVRVADPALFLAAGALAALAAAELGERPWRAASSLRAQAFGAAGVVGLGLAALAPNLLPSIWMARLQAAYPGGAYLMLADDGTRLHAAYRFSNGEAVMLRDGILQNPDPATSRFALLCVLGQREGLNRLLLVRPPEALLALSAQQGGAVTTIKDGSPAEAAVLDALGGGSSWRVQLAVPGDAGGPSNEALIFVPSPVATRGLADAPAMKSLRLSPGATLGVLFPTGAPEAEVDAAARDAAATFGAARVADLPKGVLVLASPSVSTDPSTLAARLTPALFEPIPNLAQLLTDKVRWRPAPTRK